MLVTALALPTGIAVSAVAQKGDVIVERGPGYAGMARTVNVTATITQIDAATRSVMLKGPQGNGLLLAAGPEVKNFAQLKVGDQVDVKYVKAVVLELKKGGGLPVARTDQAGAATAKPGVAPGAITGRQVTVVGDVVNVGHPWRSA